MTHTQVMTPITMDKLPEPMVEVNDLWGKSFQYQSTVDIFEWIQKCYEQFEAGNEIGLQPNPFFKRPSGKPPLTDEDVDRVIEAIDEELDHEIRVSSYSHFSRSGATDKTELCRLGKTARRALVEGVVFILDRMKTQYEDRFEDRPPVAVADPTPDSGGYVDYSYDC